jgi:hypothetical protein
MQSFKLLRNDEILPLKSSKYRITSLDEQKNKLDASKSKLDKDFTKESFGKYWGECDPFKKEKEIVAKMGNCCNVSNAWLKCYELITYYNLLPKEHKGDFIHFDNAAFPGSFILATHHYANTLRHYTYQWYGSSLIAVNKSDSAPLDDKYNLYKLYPTHWLMGENNNGDSLLEKNQMDFHNRLKNTVDLYTSDLGFDVSSDYNNQELKQCPANIGQILTGLLVLKKGGSLVTKQYTIFEPITLSVMYVVSYFFDEFYICKPATSREANSETFLVGKGFRGASVDHIYIKALFDKITNFKPTPLLDAKVYLPFIKQCIDISKDIFTKQINKIDKDVERVYKCIESKFPISQRDGYRDNPIIKEFNQSCEEMLQKWYLDNVILPITKEKRLTSVDIFYQLMH